MLIRFHNKSDIIGGQEIFLRMLITELENDFKLEYIGNDPFLLRFTSGDRSPDVEVFNGNRAMFLSIFKWKRCRWIGIQHSLFEDNQAGKLKKRIRRLLYFIILIRLNTLVQVSERCLPNTFSKSEKIKTIPNGVSAPSLISHPKDSEEFTILMVGALNTNKNQKTVVEALKLVPTGRLLLVGSGEQEKELRTLAKGINILDRVDFTGQQEDLSSYYRDADLFINASEFEACSISVIEAMSYGLPLILSDTGEALKIIKKFNCGFLLGDRLSPSEIAKHIIELQSNRQLRLEFSQNSRRCYYKEYKLEKMIDSYKNLFSE